MSVCLIVDGNARGVEGEGKYPSLGDRPGSRRLTLSSHTCPDDVVQSSHIYEDRIELFDCRVLVRVRSTSRAHSGEAMAAVIAAAPRRSVLHR
jgi:hypothetical protein